MQLGVMTGMVRSVHSCKSGLNAFKEQYKLATRDNDPTGILREPDVRNFRKVSYIKSLSHDDKKKWLERKGKSVSASIDEALVEGQYMFIFIYSRWFTRLVYTRLYIQLVSDKEELRGILK